MKPETADTREGLAETLCSILSMPIKRWLYVAAFILLFMALCVAVFAGEPGQHVGLCDFQGGLAGTLNLSREQCWRLRQLADKFQDDSAVVRGRNMEKRLALMKASKDPQTDLDTVNKLERELNALERELARRAQRIEVEQRRILSNEQIKKLRDNLYGYRTQGYDPRGMEESNMNKSEKMLKALLSVYFKKTKAYNDKDTGSKQIQRKEDVP